MTGVGSRFPCGIVEGFYGKPWSHSDRLSMIRFLGGNGFNTYIYAAKDDPHLRSKWRGAYPRGYLERIGELCDVASESSVDFAFTLSPGLDMVYSSGDDTRLLTERLRTVADVGSNWVGVLFDDTATGLVHSRDRASFSSLAEAHFLLLNDTLDELQKGGAIRLIFCPTYYANEYLGENVTENKYLEAIGNGLDPHIDVLWTGRCVVSATISEKDVEAFEAVIRRKPFLWDNYPVNDYYRSGIEKDRPRLNMGPFRGRAPEIVGHLAGYASNPMNEPEASKIPLLTLRDYLNDPHGYSPERSFDQAVNKFFSNEKSRDEIRLMIGCSMANPLDPSEVEDLAEMVRRMTKTKSESAKEKLSNDLRSRLEIYLSLGRSLSASMVNRRFLSEFQPVLDKIHTLARVGLSCLELAQGIQHRKLSAKEVRRLQTRIRVEMKQVRMNRTQAMGEVAFEEGDNADKEKRKDSVSGLGLPLAKHESPVIELYNWTTRFERGISDSDGRHEGRPS